VHAKLDQLRVAAQPRRGISHFILTPHTHVHAGAAHPASSEGLFSRALRALRSNAPTSSNSFSLCPLNPSDGPPQTPAGGGGHAHGHAPQVRIADLARLLTFEDTTGVFSVSSSTGVLEIDLEGVGKLGVDLGFWIAVALAYCEFLDDREVSRTIALGTTLHRAEIFSFSFLRGI
jgi:hypothetical protein